LVFDRNFSSFADAKLLSRKLSSFALNDKCKENSEMVGTRCHMRGLYMRSHKLECSLYVPSTNRCHHMRICGLGALGG
jgi:hypothetical protein